MRWRRFPIWVALVALFVTALLAAQTQQPPSSQVIGTVQSWNETARVFTVADDNGKRWNLTWDETTAFLSRPSVGDRVKVSYAPGHEESVRALRVGKAVKLSQQ